MVCWVQVLADQFFLGGGGGGGRRAILAFSDPDSRTQIVPDRARNTWNRYKNDAVVACDLDRKFRSQGNVRRQNRIQPGVFRVFLGRCPIAGLAVNLFRGNQRIQYTIFGPLCICIRPLQSVSEWRFAVQIGGDECSPAAAGGGAVRHKSAGDAGPGRRSPAGQPWRPHTGTGLSESRIRSLSIKYFI